MVSEFRQQHGRLVELAEAILAAAKARSAANLSQLRLALARAVIEHCRDEGVAVRGAVAGGRLCADVAAKHDRIVMTWRADLALCNSDWPTDCIIQDPTAFVDRFRPLVIGLRAEVDAEDAEILSVLETPHRAAA